MKTIKPQKLGVLSRTFENGDACYFTLSLLVFFPFAPPTAPLPEVALWKFCAGELGDEPVDQGMPKTRGEVLVTGAAHPYGGPRPVCAPRVAIGTVDKTLYVVGDRFWKGNAPSEPRPFTAMPIDYEHAFGGAGYPPNPVGKGAASAQTEHGPIHFLPNVEDPKQLLRSPADRPPPAGFGAYDFTWPQRFSKIGTYDAAWLKERFPGFAKDLDWSIWNAAPADQQITGYFQGDEPFTIEYMHPERALIEGRLPSVQTRAFITKKTAAGEIFQEIATRLDTVRLFPGAECGVLVFRGVAEVAEDDGADVVHLIAGCEDLGRPKPVEHYRTVLAQRLDRKKGHLFALRDEELLPEPRAGEAPPIDGETVGLVTSDGLMRKNVRRGVAERREKAIDDAKKQVAEQNQDPSKLDVPPLPPEPPPPSLDEIPGMIDRAEARAKESKVTLAEKLAAAKEQARAACAERGVDFDKAEQEGRAKRGGPPKLASKVAAGLGKARESYGLVNGMEARPDFANAVALPDIEKTLADIEEKTRAADERMITAYRKFAHQMAEAPRLEGDAAGRVRREVVEGHRAGRSFAGCDLTGADLSGLNLTKADFKDALLESADFSGSELGGADFAGAVLARANLTKANLFAAKLAGANLGSARLTDAEVGGGVDLTGAVLTKADLTGAHLQDARMVRAELSEATLTGTDLSRATVAEVNFIKTQFSGVKLSGTEMRKCNFIEATVTGVDFSGSRLVSSVFLATNADGADFRGADMVNLRVVKGSSFEGADFRGARLDGANLRGTKLAGADFSGAHLDGADLSECDLTGARFYRASAKGAQLVRADLTRAVMTSINLMEGSLQKAIIAGADLRGANLFRVDFARTRADAATNLKDANVKQVRIVPPKRGPHAAR